jgi:hypothetical protein
MKKLGISRPVPVTRSVANEIDSYLESDGMWTVVE